MADIARIVLDYLAEHRISAAQLARDMGVTRQAVNYWITGKTKAPAPLLLMRLADHAGDEDLRKLARELLEAMTGNNGNG